MSATTTVSIDVDAPPERVYELVSDLPRMGEWSPECVKCVWTGGAEGAAPGARFKGYNRIGWRRWSTKGEIVTAEPGREVSFDVSSLGLPVARWTYEIEPTGEGACRVTERWEDRRTGRMIAWLGTLATGVSNRQAHNQGTMRATLERLKAEVEREASPG